MTFAKSSNKDSTAIRVSRRGNVCSTSASRKDRPHILSLGPHRPQPSDTPVKCLPLRVVTDPYTYTPKKSPGGSQGRESKVARSHGDRTDRKDAFPPPGNYNIFHNPKGQWTIYHVTDLLTVSILSLLTLPLTWRERMKKCTTTYNRRD